MRYIVALKRRVIELHISSQAWKGAAYLECGPREVNHVSHSKLMIRLGIQLAKTWGKVVQTKGFGIPLAKAGCLLEGDLTTLTNPCQLLLHDEMGKLKSEVQGQPYNGTAHVLM